MLPDSPGGYRDLISLVETQATLALASTGPLPEPRSGRVSHRVRSFPVTSRVSLAPDEQAQRWLRTVSASDRSGLLYAITSVMASVMARYQVNLQLARITTLDEGVENTFLVDGPELQTPRRNCASKPNCSTPWRRRVSPLSAGLTTPWRFGCASRIKVLSWNDFYQLARFVHTRCLTNLTRMRFMFTKKFMSKAVWACCLAAPLWVLAAPIAINVDGSFGLGSNGDIFSSTTVSHTTVQGVLAAGSNVVDWYSFTGVAGATVFFDHDDANGGTLRDSTLALFRSNGEMIAVVDDTSTDAGSSTGLNAFLGAFTLTASDTYYLGLAGFSNFPDVAGCIFGNLQRPDGDISGGFGLTGCTARDFGYIGGSSHDGSYTLHISNSVPSGTVPEPASLALVGLALLAAAATRRQR